MTSNKVLRKVLKLVYFAVWGYLIISIICKKSTTITYLALGIWFGSTLAWAIWYAINKINYRIMVLKYKQVFQILQDSHSKRYRAYLNADHEAIKEYQDYVEVGSIALLKTGPVIKNDKWATEKQRKEVQEIMEKTEELTKTIKPPV